MLSAEEIRTFNDLFSNYKIDLQYFCFTKNNPYISCFIKDFKNIYSWNYESPVFISAQTGTGKNYFIQNTLVNYVNQQNIANNSYKKILLLSNRVALSRQTKKQFANSLIDTVGDDKPLKRMDYYTDEGIDTYNDFGIVIIYSYHQIYNFLITKEGREYLRKLDFKYVVFDECHFFTSDATFNRNTQFILKNCIKTFKYSTRIYMSATLEEAFAPIVQAELKFGNQKKSEDETSHYETFSCLYYYFARNYSYINEPINVYSDLMNLPKYIKGRPSDKWIIFVSSKKDGRSLVEKLNDQGIEAIFLTADSKESSSKEYFTYRSIVEEEKFPQQVLVATSVLDNGINIKDLAVKHVVIDVLDRTEFIQMLGRVRISDNQMINLYIRHYADVDIEKFLVNDIKALLTRLKTDFFPDDMRCELYQNYHSFKYDKEKIFRLTRGQKRFKYNKCAIYKLIERIAIFLKILRAKRPYYFIDLNSLGEFRTERARIYQRYLQRTTFKGSKLLRDQLCQILEIESEAKNRREMQLYSHALFQEENMKLSFDEAIRFTFLAYLFRVLIPDFVAKPYFNNVGEQLHSVNSSSDDLDFYDNSLYHVWCSLNKEDKLNVYQKLYCLQNDISSNDYLPQYEEENKYIGEAMRKYERCFRYYSSLLVLINSEIPILTEQVHWIERNYTLSSDFHYLNWSRIKLPSEEEIHTIIKKNSISLDEFKANVSKNQQNISFKNLEILQSKGSPIKSINEDYQKIFDFFSQIYSENLRASDLKEKLDKDPFVFEKNSYTLEIVRSTKSTDQRTYCIFVTLPTSKGEGF